MTVSDLHEDAARLNGTGAAAIAAARAACNPAQAGGDALSQSAARAAGDWDALIGAVADRLRQSAGACPQPTQPPLECLAQVQAMALRCADDLDRLRATLARPTGAG